MPSESCGSASASTTALGLRDDGRWLGQAPPAVTTGSAFGTPLAVPEIEHLDDGPLDDLDSTPLHDAVATMDTVTLIRSALRGVLAVADPPLRAQVRAALGSGDDYATLGKPQIDWDHPAAREQLIDSRARGRGGGDGSVTVSPSTWTRPLRCCSTRSIERPAATSRSNTQGTSGAGWWSDTPTSCIAAPDSSWPFRAARPGESISRHCRATARPHWLGVPGIAG